MPFLLLALVALFAVSILSDGLGREADVKLAIHQSESNSKLVQEQGDILTRLEHSFVDGFHTNARKSMDLVLPLKAEYFNAIKAGTKSEEFRLKTPFWRKRLEGKTFARVVLTLGYLLVIE